MATIDVAMESTSQQILSKVSGGSSAVKSVQRGFIPPSTGKTGTVIKTELGGSTYKYAYYIDVTISNVSAINKCQISTSFVGTGTGGVNYDVVCELANTNTLRIYTMHSDRDTYGNTLPYAICWEVTEFV